MNKNQVKGAAKEAAGVVQKEFGKAVDSPEHTIKGATKEAIGKTQKAVGDAQEDSKERREENAKRGV